MSALSILMLAAALTQEILLPLDRAEESEPFPADAVTRTISFTGFARASTLEGGKGYGDAYDWADLFDTGAGLGGEIAWMWNRGGQHGGVYLGIGFDRYDGERLVDDVGDTLETDDLEIVSLLAGVKVMAFHRAGWTLELRAGGGPALFGSVDADATFGGIPFTNLELYERTVVGAGEAAVRLGWGPIQVGVGGRYLAPPKVGDDFLNDVDPDPSLTVFVEAAIHLRF